MSYEQCDDQSGEFPRVNEDYVEAQTRYHYNSIARDWEFEFNFNGVIKYDLEKGTSQKYTYGDTVTSMSSLQIRIRSRKMTVIFSPMRVMWLRRSQSS